MYVYIGVTEEKKTFINLAQFAIFTFSFEFDHNSQKVLMILVTTQLNIIQILMEEGYNKIFKKSVSLPS